MRDEQEIRQAFRALAQKVVEIMWDEMRPHLEEAFIVKISEIAQKGFIYSWEYEEIITKIIREEVKKHLQTSFQPILSEIAKVKARKIIEKRAKQYGLKGLFEGEKQEER